MLILPFVLSTRINLDFMVFECDNKQSRQDFGWENTVFVLNSHKIGNIQKR